MNATVAPHHFASIFQPTPIQLTVFVALAAFHVSVPLFVL
jgi:hypothetical protein